MSKWVEKVYVCNYLAIFWATLRNITGENHQHAVPSSSSSLESLGRLFLVAEAWLCERKATLAGFNRGPGWIWAPPLVEGLTT